MGFWDGYTAGGAKPTVKAPTSGGGFWSGYKTPETATVSPQDQRTIKSFQSLPLENRNSTLVRLQDAAKKGDREAARKLTFLVPMKGANVPKTPDYTDNSLMGRLYRLDKGIGDNIIAPTLDTLLGSSGQTAGETNVQRSPKGKVTSLDAGRTNSIRDQAIDAVRGRLMVAGGVAAGAAKAPMAVGKAALQGGWTNALQAGLGEFNSGKTTTRSTKDTLTAAAKTAGENLVIGAGLGAGGKTLELAGSKLAKGLEQAATAKAGKFTGQLFHGENKTVTPESVNFKKVLTVEGNQNNLLKELAAKGDKEAAALVGTNKVKDYGQADRLIESRLGKKYDAVKYTNSDRPQIGPEYHALKTGKFYAQNEATASVYARQNREAKYAAGDATPPINVAETLQSMKANPTKAGELTAEGKTILSSEAGSVGLPDKNTTPAIAELHSKVVSGIPKEKRVDLIQGKVAKTAGQAKAQLLDRYAPIKSLSDAYERATGSKLPIENNPYGLARLHAGTPEIAAQRVDDLGSIIREAPDMQALKDVGVAQRILTDRSGIKNPISPETAQKVLDDYKAKLGPEQFAKTQETVKKVIAYHDTMLKELADNGIISRESYDAIKAKNQNYFSKFDVVDHLLDNHSNLAIGKSFNVAKQDLVKSQVGTESKIADPIEATIRQTIKGVDLINRNKVGQSLYKISQSSDLVTELKSGQSVPAGYEKISTFVDGSKVELAVPKEVGESLKHLTSHQADFVTKAMSTTGNLLRKGATSLNAGFAVVSNPLRDLQSLALNSKYIKSNPVSLGLAWTKGFAHALTDSDLYREFIANGGGQSTFFGRQPEKITELAKGIERSAAQNIGRTILNPKELFGLIPAIEGAGQKFELAPRLAEYGAAKKAGMSPTQAAFDARNVTVDFSQAGTVGQVMNQWVPFLNARLQGNVKSLEAIGRNPGRAALVAGYTIAVPTITTYMWNREHFGDVYDQIPQYVKDQNFIIVYGRNKDASGTYTDVVKIPKGDLGKIFGNTLESFLDFATHRSGKNIAQVAGEALSSLSPIDFMQDGKPSVTTAIGNALPPAIKAGVEAGTNYSFFKGGPVVPATLQGLPNSEQVRPNTSKLAKGIAGVTGQSPLKVENTIQNLTGGVTKQFESPSSLQKGITGRVSGAPGSNVDNKFYNVLNETSPLRNSASKKINDAIKAGDDSKARQIAEDYNKTLEQKFADFNKNYGKYLTEDLKKTLEDQKLKLSDRNLKSRKTRLKGK